MSVVQETGLRDSVRESATHTQNYVRIPNIDRTRM